ncbi:histidine phosphatase family protein [Rhodococcus sp. UNC363MFTsu5.1]|uniref:histidine phosphatase family protein n=1 Tax=Rhodococcus sp. UNC363MFTsu5.1 TaxID=1449069 RepID=UPI000484DA9C|nr:histidine phosphatase family protein [Rhodococcus sp. UNC363MFTsu5.1]
MTYLALIRHGETEWNAQRRLQGSSDIPLNDTGRAQAHRAADALADRTWDLLVSSPLSRATETADIIGARLGIERSAAYHDLAERHLGEAEGITDYEAYDRWPHGRYPDIEPKPAVAQRGLRAVDDLARRHPGSAIIAVTHGGVIRAVLDSVHSARSPRIRNAGISTMSHDGQRWTVHTINGVELLPRHAKS